MKRRPSYNRNGGFSLVEMLAVVAILVILLGVSAVAAARYKDYLKITELDNAAREIYLAAENRASLLNSSRRLTKLVNKGGNAVSGVETGADGTEAAGRYISCADVKSGGEGELLPAGSIDPALLNGDFYIVYEPESGCVTDVFYAESGINYTEGSFQAFYNEWKGKSRDARMRRDPMLGYYGGGKADGTNIDRIHTPGVTVLIHNEEELWVEVTFLVPDGAKSVTKTVTLEYNGKTIDLMDPLYNKRLRTAADSNSTTYAWTLDSLKRDEKDKPFSFSNLIGLESGLGKEFTVTATIEAEADGKKPAKAEASDSNNSLFAEESGGDTAKIKYLRHLQNLDKSFSGVTVDCTRAEQLANIKCYSNETYKDFKQFKPIKNEKLQSYDGAEKGIRDLYVEAEGSAGLFAKTSDGMQFKGIRLVNAFVKGTAAAGAVVGEAGGAAAFDGCQVYWEPTETSSYTDLLGSNAEGDEYKYQIIGATAGGLAGTLGENSSIKNCLSATLISGKNIAGGLVGRAESSLTISNSYADCYLTGKTSAGLVGDGGGVTLADCYAAGFIDMDGASSAAGLCLGSNLKADATHVYSVMRPVGLAAGDKFWYLTQSQAITNNDTFINTYYLNLSIPDQGISQLGRPYDEMIDNKFINDMGVAFTEKSSADSHPYNLREDLQLTNYDFPGLKGLPHYGDWTAEFKEPSLVYYEKYIDEESRDETYGFSGGNARTLIKSLVDQETITLDGYAVALLKTDLDGAGSAEAKSVTITYSYFNKKTEKVEEIADKQTVPRAKWIEAEGKMEGDTVYKKYYLIPLPDTIPTKADGDFYQYLSFSLTAEGKPELEASGEYFYNPHFAETVNPVTAQDKPAAGWTAKTVSKYANDLIGKNYRRVDLRTPRHLYELSRNPEYYHSQNNYSFQQRLDLNYRTYTEYNNGELSKESFRQAPIGTGAEPFLGTYSGGCRAICGVVFQTTAACVGLFGCSEGKLDSIFYYMPEVTLTVTRTWDTLYFGSLVGRNDGGTVSNCAASGLRLDARSTYAPFYIGGLVGWNTGIVQDCGVEAPLLSVSGIGFGTSCAGGLAGGNTGWIGTSYAVARIDGEVDQTSEVWTGGFVGENSGTVTNSYAAVHMTSSGVKAKASGFCGRSRPSGSQSGTCYLNMGNFTYQNTPYAAVYKDETSASGAVYSELSEGTLIPGMGKEATGRYPYPTAVRDTNIKSADNRIYPGQDWPTPLELGEMGIYYWEKLVVDGEARYNASLLAVDPQGETVTKQNTLSTAHDDGGVVTEYGYGYYVANLPGTDQERGVTVKAGSINYFSGGQGAGFAQDRPQTAAEDAADEALKALMPGFTFHSYLSLDLDKKVGGLYPVAAANRANGTLTLSQTGTGNVSVTFTLNPFFADAMSVTTWPLDWNKANFTAPTTALGSATNVYGVRTIVQLEFINWNSTTMNTTTVLTRDGSNNGGATNFPYLSSSNDTGKYYWAQSHDILGEATGKDEAGKDIYKTYTPIAEYYDDTGGSQGNLYGWFGGVYDGRDYVIENVNIQGQKSSCAGLFGIVYNGKLSSIILYSSDGAGKISTTVNITKPSTAWYAMGALAGVVGSSQENAVENCSVAGYTIEATVYTGGGWGGNNIGGLVGVAGLNLSNCSAVTTIAVHDATENDNMRIGGLVGACQGTISDCYSGGSISFGDNITIQSNRRGVYVGGLVGGSYFKPMLVNDGSGKYIGVSSGGAVNQTNNALSNCYSYVRLPAYNSLPARNQNGTGEVTVQNDTSFIRRRLRAVYALGGAGEINPDSNADQQFEYHKENGYPNPGTCTITNCYYLESEVLANNPGLKTAANIKTDVNNSQVTALSYEQMEGKEDITIAGAARRIYQLLTDFWEVTTEISLPGGGSYSVPGKYSYPPSSRGDLQGMDYPFPTILTRLENGQSRHVHYGQWPLNGITRDAGSKPMELDLFVGGGTLEETLKLTSKVNPGGVWTVQFKDEKPIAELQALDGQTLQDGVLTFTDHSTKELPVKLAAIPPQANEGEVIDLSAVGGTTRLYITYQEPGGKTYTREYTVRVTAELKLTPAQVTLFPNDTVELTPAVTNRQDGALNGVLKLTNVQSGGAVGAEGANYDEGGATTFTAIKLTGGAAPTTVPEVVSVTYRFTYDGKTYAATGAVLAEVVPVDVTVAPVEGSEGKSYTVGFGFGGRKVEDLTAALAQGQTGAALELLEGAVKLTLDQPPEPTRDVTLEIALTLDGWRHGFKVTVTVPPAPPEEETADAEEDTP